MSQENGLHEEKVPFVSRIGIAGADSAAAILQAMVGSSVLTYFYYNLLGLSANLISIVWLIFGVWNAVNDPLFGYISDRTKSNLGRRIPYIRYGAPIFVIGFILFWIEIPGLGNSQTALFLQMLLALFIFDSLFTAIATSLYIMPYEVAISNKARSRILIWKVVFSVFTIVTPLMLEGQKPAAGDIDEINNFRMILVFIGVAMGVIIFASTFFYRERHVVEEQKFDLVQSMLACFKNRSFVVFEVLSFTIIFAQTVLMQGLWYYFDEIATAREPLYAALAAGIIVGVVIWVTQRDRLGIKVSTRLFSLLFGIGCLVLAFLGRDLFPSLIGFALVGTGFAGGMYLIPLMNCDIMDFDEHKTGQRREGMYAGINSFVSKPAISIGQAVLITIMQRYGYNPDLAPGTQSFQAETGILLGWAAVTGALLILSFLVLHFYPLAGDDWEKIKAALAEKHSSEEKKYLESQGIIFKS